MKNKYELEIIDKYYNEAAAVPSEANEKYDEDMKNALNKMNLIKDFDMPLDLNIIEIIEQGQKINENKKMKFEIIAFILISTLIISLFIFISILYNPYIILFIELCFSFVLPLLIIPISIKTKGANR